MTTNLALIISILMHFVAAIIALTLIRKTKFMVSWILISVSLALMALRRLIELGPSLFENIRADTDMINNWLAVLISVILTLGLIFITRIFKYLNRLEILRSKSESRVLNAVIYTEEKERRRFAKDLHDGLGPLLSTIKMSVSSLTGKEKADINAQILSNIDKAINEALIATKELSNNLSPHMLDNFGLYRALLSFTDRVVPIEEIDVKISSDSEDLRFAQNVEVALYRVTCEMINNTLKHAAATQIRIEMGLKENNICVIYRDNGKGFNFEELKKNKNLGMGIPNMFSRLKSINGSVKIKSAINEGVEIELLAHSDQDNSQLPDIKDINPRSLRKIIQP